MELIDFPIHLKNQRQKVYIHGFGDIHRAATGCDVRALRRDIKRLKNAAEREDEQHFWIGTGDWCNSIGPKDRRHDSMAVAPEFKGSIGRNLFAHECDALVEDFESIKHLGIGVGAGNHEDAICRMGEFDPTERIARDLGLPYLGYSAVVRFKLCLANGKSAVVVLHYHHGKGASVSKGGKLNMLWNMRDIIDDADVYMVGHVHELLDFPDVRMSVPRRGKLRLQEKDRIFINTGTYLRAYAINHDSGQRPGKYTKADRHCDYAEKAGYRPAVIGHNGFCMRWKDEYVAGTSNRAMGYSGRSVQRVRLSRVDFAR